MFVCVRECACAYLFYAHYKEGALWPKADVKLIMFVCNEVCAHVCLRVCVCLCVLVLCLLPRNTPHYKDGTL